MSVDLGRSAARGAATTAASQAVRIAIQIASLAVLARLLAPGDYGLLAMALAVVGVGHLLRDMGLYSAAVRAPELSTAQRDNLFWVNAALGVLLAVACCAAGPLLALAYGRDELVGIAIGLAPNFVLAGLATQYRAGLVRELRFTSVAMGDLASQAVGVLAAILIAALGGGYWALVAQHSVSSATFLVITAFQGAWLPGRVTRGVGTRPLIGLGGSVMASSLLTYVSNNLDAVVIGGAYGAEPAGLYNRGSQVVRSTLKQLSAPVGVVALPVMGRLQHDTDRLMAFAYKVQLVVGYPTAVTVALMVGLPDDVVRLVLGEGWSGASDILVWLAVAAMLAVVGDVAGLVLVARGHAAALARLSVVTTCTTVVGVLGGLPWGPEGVALGLAVAALLNFPVAFVALSRSARVPAGGLALGAVRLALLAASGAVGLRLSVTHLDGSAALRVLVACGAVLAWFALVSVLVPRMRRDAVLTLRTGRAALGR